MPRKEKRDNFNWLNPEFFDSKSAKDVAIYGVYASLLLALIGSIKLVIDFLNNAGPEAYYSIFDIVLVLFVAFFIYKMKRWASIVGLVYFILLIVITILNGSNPITITNIVAVLAYINTIRATFFYYKLLEKEKAI